MKKFVILFTALFLLLGSAFALSIKDYSSFNDLEKSFLQAQEEGKAVLILITDDGCVYCDKLKKEVFSQTDAADIIKKYFIVAEIHAEDNLFLYLNIDTGMVDPLGEKVSYLEFFGIIGGSGVPTTVFFDKTLAYVGKVPGALPKNEYLKLIKYVGEEIYTKDIALADYDPDKDY